MTLEEKHDFEETFSEEWNNKIWIRDNVLSDEIWQWIETKIDEACKKQREAIANEFGVDCPDCDNCGYTIQADFNGEPCQVQCEFCYTEKHSKFNYLSAPSPKESE